jgi:CRISPR/Cas system CSM-associated protein Csm2 small subunit
MTLIFTVEGTYIETKNETFMEEFSMEYRPYDHVVVFVLGMNTFQMDVILDKKEHVIDFKEMLKDVKNPWIRRFYNEKSSVISEEVKVKNRESGTNA